MASHVRSSNRSSYAFIIGLLAAAGVAVGTDGWGRFMAGTEPVAVLASGKTNFVPIGPRGTATEDLDAARVAWRYFEQNTRDETGLVDSVKGFASGTLWDQGSYLLALVSAEALGLIDRREFDLRTGKFLDSLASLPLFENALPNKVYNTVTLEMVDYGNNVAKNGIGWSALDVARLLTAMRVLERRAPEYGAQVRAILLGWNLEAMTQDGGLIGASAENGETLHLQEGRIGYEQYAARAAAMWGLDVASAISAAPILRWRRISGVEVPTDRRDHSAFKAITPILSEPYIMMGLELGLDSESLILASRVFEVQQRRYRETGIPTMVSEDHVSEYPHFLYSSVFSNGDPWAVVSEDGARHNDLRTISLKAVFGWDALYDTDYTQNLREQLAHLASSGGWMAGEYEVDRGLNDVLTLNTNAVVLEAVHYMTFGPLWKTRD